MINQVYRLTAPRSISLALAEISLGDRVIVRPQYMALCHADMRYYYGQRSADVLRRKLPMALIHECCAEVVYDPTGMFRPRQLVVPIPNVPGQDDGFIYENYARGSRFLSSGSDGFMRELVDLDAERLVDVSGVDRRTAAITEFISVAVHASHRFEALAHPRRGRIGVWGDGSLAYVVTCVLKARFPQSLIAVIGHNAQKLGMFNFADERYLAADIPADFEIDHAFECCGGDGSDAAIEDIIRYIRPQGTLLLMGVSENRIPVNTRMVLEKGMTLAGCSRSGRVDFETAAELLRGAVFARRIRRILYEDAPVRSIADIHRVFATDLSTPFKTVFQWKI